MLLQDRAMSSAQQGRAMQNVMYNMDGSLKAAFMTEFLWDNGATLNVAFLGGSQDKKDWVKKIVKNYLEPYVNLTFNFVDGANGDIRISFDPYGGAWSYLGTQVKGISSGQPTMNLGWLDAEGERTPGAGSGSVIIHEFCHAIGMIHEHQNPRGADQICWNKDEVYASLSGPPNNWSRTTIDHNMFAQYDIDTINGSNYDPYSIMHYIFPKTWFTEGAGCAPYVGSYNKYLSQLDSDWLGKMYPSDSPNPPPPSPDTFDPDVKAGTNDNILSGKTTKQKLAMALMAIATVLILVGAYFMIATEIKKSGYLFGVSAIILGILAGIMYKKE